MPNHTHRRLTRSSTRQDSESFGGLLPPPRSQLARRTLSANSELSEDSVRDVEVGPNILATASEDELLRSGNIAYMRLLDAYNHAKKQYNKINERYVRLKSTAGAAAHSSSTSSLPTLAAPIPMPSVPPLAAPIPMPSVPPPPAPAPYAHVNPNPGPNQRDYPNIQFWFKRDYTQAVKSKKSNDGVTALHQEANSRGRSRLSESNVNVMCHFIELQDGTVVDGVTAEHIRARFRDTFAEQKISATRMQESVPNTWGEASAGFKKFLIKEIYDHFPYMRLCDNDWKVHYLAARVYPNWLKTQRKKEQRMEIKVEKTENSVAIGFGASTKSMKSSDSEELTDVAQGLSVRVLKRKVPEDVEIASPQQVSKRVHVESHHDPAPASASDTSTQATPVLPPSLSLAAPSTPPETPTLAAAASSSHPGSHRDSTQASERAADSGAQSCTTPVRDISPSTDATATSSSLIRPLPRPRPRPRPCRRVGTVAAVPTIPTTTNTEPPLESNTQPKDDLPTGLHALVEAAEQQTTTSISPPAIVNPLNSLFGPAVGPSARLESLSMPSGKPDHKPESSTTGKVSASGPGLGMKRATASTTAKNLCYIKFLEDNQPITCAAFESYYKGLSKPEIKRWNDLSKASKSQSTQARAQAQGGD